MCFSNNGEVDNPLPSRETIHQNLPDTFQQLYLCVIDCSEVLETPMNFEARSKTYSNYKRHNTVK